MDKIFVVVEIVVDDGDTSVAIRAFSSQEKANNYFNERMEKTIKDCSFGDSTLIEEGPGSFEMYEDSFYNKNRRTIYVEEAYLDSSGEYKSTKDKEE